MNSPEPRILVVDDSPLTLTLVMENTPRGTYRIYSAMNGREALKKLHRIKPDVVVLDVIIPEVSGISVCKSIKEDPEYRSTRVILLSSNNDIQEKVLGLDSGADDFMVKPLHTLELLARIRAQLRIKSLTAELEQKNQLLQKLSAQDPLTNLHNRSSLRQRLDNEFHRARRYKKALSCLMIDVDHFKRINDQYGHSQGDKVLLDVSQVLKESVRNCDVAARYGGEEFTVIYPETSLSDACVGAERIRRNLSEKEIPVGKDKVNVTVSIGVGFFPHEEIETGKDLLVLADRALYKAKESGRNRVEVYQGS